MAELARATITISGRVQGVFYRAFTSRISKSLNLKGYVHNLPQGNVEVIVEGSKNKIEELINHLKVGPPEAFVENVDVKWSDYTGQFVNFDVV